MGEDGIKDVEIKTECFVQQDVVLHPGRRGRRSHCFPFIGAVMGRKDSFRSPPCLFGVLHRNSICSGVVFIGTFFNESSKKYNDAVGVC